MVQVSDPTQARSAAIEIVRTLRQHGFIAYFAGGCVRDELLGLRPSDFDVATAATPRQIESALPQPRFSTHFVGEAFGVTLVKIAGVHVEVATFRSDGTYTDKRRPDSVVFSTPQDDAMRRDFTINALFLDPLATAAELPDTGRAPTSGQVIDLVDGLRDLRTGLIRAVGDAHARLREDHLRALRAVRFAARFGFAIEPTTARAIRSHAAELAGVSRERIGDEVRRMLLRGHAARLAAMRLLDELGLDEPIFGPAEVLAESAARQPGTGDRYLSLQALAGDAAFGELLAALLVDRHPGAAVAGKWRAVASLWRTALCLSNEETAAIAGTLDCLSGLQSQWSSASVAGQKRLAAKDHFQAAVALYGAGERGWAAQIMQRVSELEAIGSGIHPSPILTGDDLVAAGLVPGPTFKRLLDRVYDAQLEGRIHDFDEAMELVRQQRIK